MNIGKNIKKYRELRGMTVEQIGTEIGMSWARVSWIEDGVVEPSITIIQDLAEILEVPITDLLGLPERPSRESITLQELFQKQYELDEVLLSRVKEITPKELLLSRVVAMFTEIGEWANEEQSMKYWKHNKSSDREKELEEYADIWFFLLSIGNLKGYSPGEVEKAYMDKWNKNIKRQQEGY